MNRSRQRSISRQRSKSKSRQRSKSRSRTKSNKSINKSYLPMCPLIYYCGNSMKIDTNKYDKIGNGYDCFKKGMGVGMNLELKKVKTKLKEKGIELITKALPKMKCVDSRGRIKEITKYK